MGPPISVPASTLLKLLCDRLEDESCPEEERAARLWKIFRSGEVFVDRKDVLLEESLQLREELRAETPDSTCFKSLTLRCAVVDAELKMLCDGAGTYPDACDALKSTPRLSELFGGFNVKISRKTSWRYTTLPEPPLPNGIQRKTVQKFDDEIFLARA
jgi:hypothetical protein